MKNNSEFWPRLEVLSTSQSDLLGHSSLPVPRVLEIIHYPPLRPYGHPDVVQVLCYRTPAKRLNACRAPLQALGISPPRGKGPIIALSKHSLVLILLSYIIPDGGLFFFLCYTKFSHRLSSPRGPCLPQVPGDTGTCCSLPYHPDTRHLSS